MKNWFAVLLLLVGRSAFAQKTDMLATDLTTLKFSVEEAPEWSDLLKRSTGWFGGDGIYTIPLDGRSNKPLAKNGKVLFLFSDSMIGQIRDNTMMPGYKMIHNSIGILKGSTPEQNNMLFYWDKDKEGRPESIFIPKTPRTEKGDYYWLGSGFVNHEAGDNVYIFGYRIRNVADGAFGFKEVGNTLLKVPVKDIDSANNQQQMDTPFYLSDKQGESGSFGAGVYVNTKHSGAPNPDGYIYVYGVAGRAKNLLVARVLPQYFEDFTKWSYWDGNSWSADIEKADKVTNSVSNELSLSPLPDGRYALIFQLDGISKYIGLRIGKTPYGPFGPVIKIWDCSKDLLEKTYLVYNAKAHSVLSKPGELLVSYNINSVEFIKDLGKYPYLYHPRFIRIKFE